MLPYVIAGLVLGGIYAISASALVATYLSTGILNFSFGALAYFIARFYYFLHVQHAWGIAPAAVVAMLIAAPLTGVGLYFVLFRSLSQASPLIKVVATLGLSVAIPPLATLLFGDVRIIQVPGLAPEPVHVYHLAGVAITLNQLIVYGCVLAVVVVGAAVVRFTDVGLRVRAMVDSPAMTSLSGTNPGVVAVGVWALSVFMAGLAGVLSAPIIGLDANDFTLLMASAFAAVVAAKLRSVPIAVLVAFAMGIAGALVQKYLPPSSSFTAAVIPSIPFAVTGLFLLYNLARGGIVNESAGVGGALDRAIAAHGGDRLTTLTKVRPMRPSTLAWQLALLVAIAAVVPYVMDNFWVGFLAQGAAFAVIFLSFTLVTGEGGMIWLCQITFAGVGALTAAQLGTEHGWPILAAVLAGGLIAAPMGAIVGFLTIRLGPLYIALVTLTFGLLMERLVFSREIFAQHGLGVSIALPQIAPDKRSLTYLALIVFGVCAAFIVNLRRSTTGLALNAVRWSEPGSKTIGLSVLQMKILVAALAAFVAGVGGALLAVANGVALPANYTTLEGVIWFATLVTAGVRSNVAALIAGATYTLLPAAFQLYLPESWAPVPTILFGLGAVWIARNPEGWIPQTADQLRWLWGKARPPREQLPPRSTGASGTESA